jgi:uncharacterized membrane protein YqhA
MLARILGTSRFLITLAVLGSFITAAALMVVGLDQSLALVRHAWDSRPIDHEIAKELIVEAISVIDIFLLGTVLYIISAGLYQLFVDHELRLPRWLTIHSLDDLKARLTGVIVVGLLVAFLGYVIEWKGGLDLLAPGIAISAIVIAAGVYFRLVHPPADGGGHGAPHVPGRPPGRAPAAAPDTAEVDPRTPPSRHRGRVAPGP